MVSLSMETAPEIGGDVMIWHGPLLLRCMQLISFTLTNLIDIRQLSRFGVVLLLGGFSFVSSSKQKDFPTNTLTSQIRDDK